MVVSRDIPRVDPDAWREVARLTTLKGEPVTPLSVVIVDSSGADQMCIKQTLTFFSEEVGTRKF